MIRLATQQEVEKYIKDDPVRPHISLDWRTQKRREVYVLENNDSIDAVVCVAYTSSVPKQEVDMENVGLLCAVFYTVWSYKRGAGRDIVNGVAEEIKKTKPWVERFVTLSPLTTMAERFHIRNGAKFLAKHEETQNFEYEVC